MSGPKRLNGANEHTGDRGLDATQERVRRIERAFNACPFLFGVLRTLHFNSFESKIVSHGLGQQAAFMIVRGPYNCSVDTYTVCEDAQSGIDVRNQIRVIGASFLAFTVDLWFYPAASEAQPR